MDGVSEVWGEGKGGGEEQLAIVGFKLMLEEKRFVMCNLLISSNESWSKMLCSPY